MDVTLPNGKIVRNVPPGTTKEQLIERLRAAGYDLTGIVEPTQAKIDPTEGMSTGELLLAGTGKAFADVGRGVGQMVGLVSRKDVEESRKLDEPLMKRGAAQVGNVGGNVAVAVPAALIPGANTILGGAAVGGALGLAQPSTSTNETFTNILMGGGAGAAFPLFARMISAAKAMAEPFYEAGKNRIVGRALRDAAGSKADEVARTLEDASRPFIGPQQPDWTRSTMGEFVPGSLPTVAEASGNPGIAALQRAALASNPEVTTQVTERFTSNADARRAALASMSGADGARDMAKATLDATGDMVYQRAFGQGVPQLTPAQVANVAEFMKRVPESAIDRAKTLAKIRGITLDDTTSLQGMHWVKMALDDQISSAVRSGDATLARSLQGLQRDLLTGMDALSPDYAAARAVYRDLAKPVNEFDTVARIFDKATPNKLTNNVQPNAFAKALSDRTAQQATGFPKATLENTLTNATRNKLDALLQDLLRVDFAQNAGRGAGSDTVQKLAYTNVLNQAGVPTWLQELAPAQVAGNILARGADAAYARANRELSQRLAETMLDPAQAAELLRRATPEQRRAISLALDRMGILGDVVRSTPRIGLLSLPATAPVAANAE